MLLGLQIISQFIRRIFGNGNAVLRIFMIPTMLTIIAMDRLQLYCLFSPSAIDVAIKGGYFPWASTAGLILTVELFFLRCAVSWHRLILLGEAPRFPRLRLRRVWAYFRRSLWLLILAVPALFVVGLAAGALAVIAVLFLRPDLHAEAAGPATLLAWVLVLPVLALNWRLAASLPGAALDTPASVRLVWRSMGSQFRPLLVIAAFGMAVSQGSVHLMSWAGVPTETPTGAAIRVTATALQLILTLSLLTTLYGHYVEKRPLA